MDENHNVVPCQRDEWFKYYENGPDARRVAMWAGKGVTVSTVFLAMNHGFGGDPLWFETLVFGGAMDDEMRRYATWNEAVQGHNEVVEEVEATMRTRMITFEED
jgi:hypothetical protein